MRWEMSESGDLPGADKVLDAGVGTRRTRPSALRWSQIMRELVSVVYGFIPPWGCRPRNIDSAKKNEGSPCPRAAMAASLDRSHHRALLASRVMDYWSVGVGTTGNP